ncbi:MAG: elongation factor P-like protein YeiP [Pseudomonadota bacterium]
MKASELKKGMVIDVDGRKIIIKALDVQSPSSRSGSTLYKARGFDIVTRAKYENRFKGDDIIQPVDFSRRPVQYLYRDADGCTFMDRETYDQYTLAADALEEELQYLTEELEGVLAIIADGLILGIELPATVVLPISETAPGMKAASASSRTKPATLSTGLVVQVPEYLTAGELIKVNTGSGEYISRA